MFEPAHGGLEVQNILFFDLFTVVLLVLILDLFGILAILLVFELLLLLSLSQLVFDLLALHRGDPLLVVDDLLLFLDVFIHELVLGQIHIIRKHLRILFIELTNLGQPLKAFIDFVRPLQKF